MMKHSIRLIRLSFVLFALCCFVASSAFADTNVTIAVIYDFEPNHKRERAQRYIDELSALVESEFDLTFIYYQIDWTSDNFNRQIDRLYQDSQVDMVLALGVAANQLIIKRESYSKPTFLPFIIERDLVQAPFKNGVSNKHNLSYLSYSTQFIGSIKSLREVVEFSNVVVLADELLFKALPPAVLTSAQESGSPTLQLVTHDGVNNDLVQRIPEGAEAVMFGHLPRLSEDDLVTLIHELTERNLPTFSYLEEGLVEKGLLATPLNASLYQHAARRNALNMQAVMLGEQASQQPVTVEAKSKLTINQATAERLGVAIDFKVLVDADVIGFGTGTQTDSYSLLDIAHLAVDHNLELKTEQFSVDIQANEQQLAKGRLRPQLSVDTSVLRRRDDTGLVQSGFAAEESTDVAINLNQTLFSDSQRTNYKIQKLLLEASSAQYREVLLNTIRDASLAMADVLQAQSQAAIQQENLSFSERNLELAVDRVTLGASTSADQYRWETQVANAKSAVFDAFSRVLITKQNLNRILNRPITQPIELQALNLDTLMVFSTAEAFDLLDNTSSFERAYTIGLEKAVENSPEIQRLDALKEAKRREVVTLARRNWLPEISLNGQISENVDNTNVLLNNDDGRDWQLILNARIPFYQGGQIKSQVKKAKLELAQIDSQLSLVKQQLAQVLRASMNNLLTALFNLRFSNDAAAAASRSLSLVTDAYSKGALPIVDLLDAQNASVSANLAEVQASISYFRSTVEMQRTIGVYEFLMSVQQKQELRKQLQTAMHDNGN